MAGIWEWWAVEMVAGCVSGGGEQGVWKRRDALRGASGNGKGKLGKLHSVAPGVDKAGP